MTTLFKKAWMDMKKGNPFAATDEEASQAYQNAIHRKWPPNNNGKKDDKEDDEKDTKKAVDNTTARNQHYDESEKSTQNGKQVKVTWPPKDQEERKAKLADEARRAKIESERDAKKAEGNTYAEKGSGDYTNDPEYKKLVQRLIRQGMSNSDAQGMADAKFDPRINGSKKSQEETVEKPGDATHSTKWDDCVKEAQAKNPKSNVYAICTAQLGEESFKSQYRHLASMRKEIREARKAVGTSGFAGGIPNSLLADQDLEGVADDSEEAIRDGESRQNILLNIE